MLGIACVILAACTSGGGGDTPGDQGRAGEVVRIRGIAFRPDEVEIPAGATVKWVNQDDVTHTVTTGEPGEQRVPGVTEGVEPSPDGLIDERLSGRGDEVSFTFERPGTYTYFCRLHSAMTGTVVVN